MRGHARFSTTLLCFITGLLQLLLHTIRWPGHGHHTQNKKEKNNSMECQKDTQIAIGLTGMVWSDVIEQ